VQRVIRSLFLRFDAKVSNIEEMKDLESLTMDELHEIITSYEMRTKHEKPLKREANCKVAKKQKINNPKLAKYHMMNMMMKNPILYKS
jgi:hypothetical protein